jgi:hypothetical protein
VPLTKLTRHVAFCSGGFTKPADRLEQTELIKRQPSPSDRRLINAVLTVAGRAQAERAAAAYLAGLRELVLRCLGTQDLRVLADHMRRLIGDPTATTDAPGDAQGGLDRLADPCAMLDMTGHLGHVARSLGMRIASASASDACGCQSTRWRHDLQRHDTRSPDDEPVEPVDLHASLARSPLSPRQRVRARGPKMVPPRLRDPLGPPGLPMGLANIRNRPRY